eukprot:m.172763 g.172763  ORF g.172763 m.172763 type:complete len:569 (-) comp18292_c0_seq6:430-2136(-)
MGTTPYPDERSLAMASRRGVIITASHFEILGFNAFAWSQAFQGAARELWDWTEHPDLMGHVFEATIAAQRAYEMIWSVGLRGLNDYAYPNCDNADPGPLGCGAIISQAVGNQTQLLSQLTGQPVSEIKFKFNLWTEALGLYQKGLLKLPPQTSLVMSDSGAGFIHGDDDTFHNADGVYYHVQMLNGYGGQLTEFVPPSRIFEQLSTFCARARSTSIFVLNLSDLKPAVLTAQAALQFVWNASVYAVNASVPGTVNRTADEAQAEYLQAWVAQQFRGADTSTQASIASLWSQYFDLGWIQQGGSDEKLAGIIGNIASELAKDIENTRAGQPINVSANTLKSATQGYDLAYEDGGLGNATAVYTSAVALLPSVPVARQQFFRSHIVVQSAMQRFSVGIIAALANATIALSISHGHATSAAVLQVQAALGLFDDMFQAQRDAEGPGAEWRGMYWADRHRFTNFQARRREVLRLAAALEDPTTRYAPPTMIDCCQVRGTTPQRRRTFTPLVALALFFDHESLCWQHSMFQCMHGSLLFAYHARDYYAVLAGMCAFRWSTRTSGRPTTWPATH